MNRIVTTLAVAALGIPLGGSMASAAPTPPKPATKPVDVPLSVCNNTPYLMRVSIDGPSAYQDDLGPYGVCTAWQPVKPGRYEFVLEQLRTPSPHRLILQTERGGHYAYKKVPRPKRKNGVAEHATIDLGPGKPATVRLIAVQKMIGRLQ